MTRFASINGFLLLIFPLLFVQRQLLKRGKRGKKKAPSKKGFKFEIVGCDEVFTKANPYIEYPYIRACVRDTLNLEFLLNYTSGGIQNVERRRRGY